MIFGEDLDGGPHFAVAEAAVLVARYQQVAALRELGVHLRDEPRHHHGIHVRASDQESVDHIWRRKPKCHVTVHRNSEAGRHEHELRRDRPDRHAATAADCGAEILLGKFSRQMQRFRIYPFDIARRIDAHLERGKQNHAQSRCDKDADPKSPEKLRFKDPPLMHFGMGVGHRQPTVPRGINTRI